MQPQVISGTLNLDLDALPATWVLEVIDRRDEVRSRRQRRLLMEYEPSAFRYFGPRRWELLPGPGLRFEALLDWRRLERLAHRLNSGAQALRTAFWSIMAQLQVSHRVDQVWLPEQDPQYTMVYREGGLSTRTTQELIDKGIGKPLLTPYVVQGDEGRRLRAVWYRSERLSQRGLWALSRFRTAVEARLTPYVAQHLRSDIPHSHFPVKPSVLLVQVDDRVHVVNCDQHGVFSWSLNGMPVVSLR